MLAPVSFSLSSFFNLVLFTMVAVSALPAVLGKKLAAYIENMTGSAKRDSTDTPLLTDAAAKPSTPGEEAGGMSLPNQEPTHEMNNEELLIDLTTSSSEQSSGDESVGENNVYMPTVALIPRCNNVHGKIKGKAREDQPRLSKKARECGRFDHCDEGLLAPITARTPDFRLTTDNALHDLKRWLTTPNSRLGGCREQRSAEFLQSDHFTEQDLYNALIFAVDEIRYEHAHITSLVEYGGRYTYYIGSSRTHVTREANKEYVDMQPAHFVDVPRDGLVKDVAEAAAELDYLREVADSIGYKIMDAKGRAARNGNRTEIAELLRLEVVDVEWVQEKCLLI